ncbi:MAG: hypothetical protein U5K54_12760 [Cytophagales bacterium]|nr:hypothetical protein [Cytophagales bacterium]
MDENIYDDLIEEIRKVSLAVNGVLGTEKCFIRKDWHEISRRFTCNSKRRTFSKRRSRLSA